MKFERYFRHHWHHRGCGVLLRGVQAETIKEALDEGREVYLTGPAKSGDPMQRHEFNRNPCADNTGCRYEKRMAAAERIIAERGL